MNDDRVKRVLELVSQGWSVAGACGVVGIDYDRFMKLVRGCRELEVMLRAAEEAAVGKMEEVIKRAVEKGDWRAAAWWLERRYRMVYGRRNQTDVNVLVGRWEDLLKGAFSGKDVDGQDVIEVRDVAGLESGVKGVLEEKVGSRVKFRRSRRPDFDEASEQIERDVFEE